MTASKVQFLKKIIILIRPTNKKVTSNEISEKQVIAEKTEVEIDEAR